VCVWLPDIDKDQVGLGCFRWVGFYFVLCETDRLWSGYAVSMVAWLVFGVFAVFFLVVGGDLIMYFWD